MSESSKAVFLSYASEDAEAAARICEALRSAGIEVWFDQSELRGGDAWDASIRKQIKNCGLFIPIISANAHARVEGYFRLEWKLAVDRSHLISSDQAFLLPVVIDDTRDDDERIPERFRELQWTRLAGGETPAAFCERVKVLLGGGEPAVRPRSSVGLEPTALPKRTSHRWQIIAATTALMAVVIGWQAWRVMQLKPSSGGPPTAVATVPDKSIAVLPFVDMSEKRDQEYFSDGLSEELIDHLSHSPDLKVIGRTSSFAFKGKTGDMRTIAATLGVAHLLEGSVRKAGDELRITAQLVRASDGVHLWSQSFDRRLKDIFKVQEEIADTVAKELNVVLGAGGPAASSGTNSVEAYNVFLKGNYFYLRGNVGDNQRAIKEYKEALALDPNYAISWAQLSRTYLSQGLTGELTSVEVAPKARDAVRRALAIDPDVALGHYALGLIYRYFDYDWQGAKRENERVIALHAPGALGMYARQNILEMEAMSTGQFGEALAAYREGTLQDPLDTTTLWSMQYFQTYAGKLEEATATSRKLLDLNPEFSTAWAQYGQTLLLMGKKPEALAATERESDAVTKLYLLACVYWSMGQRPNSDTALKEFESNFSQTAAFFIGSTHAWRGESDAAIAWFERAYRQRDSQMVYIRAEPFVRGMHNDPRYKALLKKMNLPET